MDERTAVSVVTRAWTSFKACRTARALKDMKVHCLHGCYDANFLQSLHERMTEIPSSTASKNMYAVRHFLRDECLAAAVFAGLPKAVVESLGLSGCCSDLRFIRYPLGGYIAPHTDGVRIDEGSSRQTSVSFLLYLSTVPEGEGGETTFLDKLPENCSEGETPKVVWSCRPIQGAILLFPHTAPHVGEACGVAWSKVLLRGDLY